jgi:FlaA1/EpsC-like NDP-sugar epimerase
MWHDSIPFDPYNRRNGSILKPGSMNNPVIKILSLPRTTKRLIVLGMDLLLLPLALWVAFSLRYGEVYVPVDKVIYLFLVLPVIAVPIFGRFGLYRAIIRYIGFKAMWAIFQAVSLYTLVWGVLVLLSGIPGVPRSVLLINWLVTILLIGGTRAIARWWLSGSFNPVNQGGEKKRVIIYGAGSAGIQIANALASSRDFNPVAFIDDNPSLQRNYIQGLRIHPFSKIASLIEKFAVNEVLLAMPSLARSRRREVISRLEPYAVHVMTLPGMDDLASGKVKVDDVREVGVRDLLGRDQVEPNLELLHANVKGKAVLVTGAGGSIGSELCRQIIRIKPKMLVLYERSEPALYAIENELIALVQRLYPDSNQLSSNIVPILASVATQTRLESVCAGFGIQTIYHAAAYKHVPMVEKNPLEAVRNNVLGTFRATQAAINTNVETFVLISTDKAVRPTNTMGASKRFAELILQGYASRKEVKTRFTMVRFGNVLESSGSVVPLFREQIKNGGPVTVTDPKIIRYFMTIPEAAQLVIQAGAMGQGGDVFVLDMGEPVKILDMAKRMIRLSGFEIKDEENPDGDIEIAYTGLRPGEKLYEELLIGENVKPTQHQLIMSADEDYLPWLEIEKYIELFGESIGRNDVEKNRSLLLEAVKGFSPQCEVADLVFEYNRNQGKTRSEDNVVKIKR